MSRISDYNVDAQNLISMSLLKIHNSRTQRGGIKLHKNLLVSSVLRNARQVYIREVYMMQQYEEVKTFCNGIQELNPLDLQREDDGEDGQARSVCCGAAAGQCGCPPSLPGEDSEMSPCNYGRCFEASPPPTPANSCNKTTVLDLDTHMVTTVENRCLHQDCPGDAPAWSQQAAQGTLRNKRTLDSCYIVDFEDVLVPPAPRKRSKPEEDLSSNSECPDTSNISNLISIFGSGFSELLSRQADLDQICSRPPLGGLGACRAIIAY